MAKHKLVFEEDYDFVLFGISCHQKDYRLCWNINKHLGINLVKQAELEFHLNKGETSFFSNYNFYNEVYHQQYELISNRANNATLIPEQKQADYLLKVTGIYEFEEKIELQKKLNEISVILTAFEINIDLLKSKELLIF